MRIGKTTVVASMRNEGPFIVEWVAWYRMLGFTDLVVVTNDCTDRSPALLDALQAAGWLHHIRHDVPPGEKITFRKLDAARTHSAVSGADWVMVCDVDEFLVIHRGAGLLSDLLSPHHLPDGAPDFLGMSINWRVFGTDDRFQFEDLPVHRQFLTACGRDHQLSNWVKSIFRCPGWFGALRPHGPRQLSLELAGQAWGDPGMRWITADGLGLDEWLPDGDYVRRTMSHRVSHSVAQINHYMLRSIETFSLKAGTPSPAALKDRYSDGYFARANAGSEHDASALRQSAAWERVYREAMALPQVAELHRQCCDDHRRLIAERNARPD